MWYFIDLLPYGEESDESDSRYADEIAGSDGSDNFLKDDSDSLSFQFAYCYGNRDNQCHSNE